MSLSKVSRTKSVRGTGNIPSSGNSSRGQKTPAFRFMDLPQELRDMVYGHLLCPHLDGRLHQDESSIRDYDLEPAILRTCKQICEEGSRVLYTKNETFLIQVNAKEYRQRSKNSTNLDILNFERFCAVAKVDCGKFGGVPVLTVDLSAKGVQVKPTPAKITRAQAKRVKGVSLPEGKVSWIGFLPTLSKFCTFLSSCSGKGKLQLVVNLEQPIGRSPEKHREMLVDCLERLCEARRLGQVTILTDSQHSDTAASTAKLMMTGMESFEDVVSQVSAYEARVSRQLKDEKWEDARDTLQNALVFFDHNKYLINSTEEREFELHLRQIDIQRKYISCCLKVGRTGDVRAYIRRVYGGLRLQDLRAAKDQSHWTRVADAHCAIGKAYVIDGALNSALYSFLQALLAAPGHAKADQALDHLEARVTSSSKPQDVMVKLNIECILENVRHQAPGQRRVSDKQIEKLFGGFRATCYEIEGLLRGERVFCIPVMEPWDEEENDSGPEWAWR